MKVVCEIMITCLLLNRFKRNVSIYSSRRFTKTLYHFICQRFWKKIEFEIRACFLIRNYNGALCLRVNKLFTFKDFFISKHYTAVNKIQMFVIFC